MKKLIILITFCISAVTYSQGLQGVKKMVLFTSYDIDESLDKKYFPTNFQIFKHLKFNIPDLEQVNTMEGGEDWCQMRVTFTIAKNIYETYQEIYYGGIEINVDKYINGFYPTIYSQIRYMNMMNPTQEIIKQEMLKSIYEMLNEFKGYYYQNN